ncbi:GA-like domain-containing protein [Escherichia coli]|uniref:GA-like domain-containing protein n=1 Tax=Escherichia coli TaxID=562 RepID=UPI003D9CA5C9
MTWMRQWQRPRQQWEAAEAADQAAKDKLAELNADNLITPEEKAQLEAAKQNADTLKEEANSAVQALPDTVAEKGDLQDRVDALDGIQVPEVNDQDGNGRADDLDAAVAAGHGSSGSRGSSGPGCEGQAGRAECRQSDHAGREGAAGSGEAEC